MRIDKDKISPDNDEPMKVTDAVDPDQILQKKLEEEKAAAKAKGDDSEYEYVTLSEATSGTMTKLKKFLSEYYVVVGFAGILLVATIILSIGRNASSLFIAIAFGFLAFLTAVILFMAWRDKREAEEAYTHAIEILEPVKDKMREQATQDEDEDE